MSQTKSNIEKDKTNKTEDMSQTKASATTTGVDRNQLPSLPVEIPTSNKTNLAAAGDDLIQRLNSTWFKMDTDLIRIATIGDSHCFVHATLKGFYAPYQDNPSYRFRTELAQSLRRDLSEILGYESPDYPGYLNWETAGNGIFLEYFVQELVNPELVNELRTDYSFKGIKALFNSTTYLGDASYQYISDLLNIDIYVLRATARDLFPHLSTEREDKKDFPRWAVVIVGNEFHYEPVGIVVEENAKGKIEKRIQTAFLPDHPFIKSIRGLRKEERKEERKVGRQVKYNPEQHFIQTVASAFSRDYTEDFLEPDMSYLEQDDPFLLRYQKLRPKVLSWYQDRKRTKK